MNEHVAVYMLDVGQGDCTVVLLPDGRLVIFDCKDDHVLRRLLEGWGKPAIVAFVLSHLDQDHIAGALPFLQGWTGTIDTVYLSTDRDVGDDHDEAKRAKKLLDYVVEHDPGQDSRPRRWNVVPNTRDERPLASGAGWSVTLLAPPYGKHIQRERTGDWEDANRYSSILRVQAGARAMLIGGDAPLRSWSKLRAEELKADAFRIPHHGGALDDGGKPEGWDVARLYTEVGAATALISVGTNNAYGHPSEDWIEPISGKKCRLLCTQVTARCHAPLNIVASDGKVQRNRIEIEKQRGRVLTKQNQWTGPQYRHLVDRRRGNKAGLLEVPCAGTVVVKLPLNGGEVTVLPAPGGAHEQVVEGWHRPLCHAPAL